MASEKSYYDEEQQQPAFKGPILTDSALFGNTFTNRFLTPLSPLRFLSPFSKKRKQKEQQQQHPPKRKRPRKLPPPQSLSFGTRKTSTKRIKGGIIILALGCLGLAFLFWGARSWHARPLVTTTTMTSATTTPVSLVDCDTKRVLLFGLAGPFVGFEGYIYYLGEHCRRNNNSITMIPSVWLSTLTAFCHHHSGCFLGCHKGGDECGIYI